MGGDGGMGGRVVVVMVMMVVMGRGGRPAAAPPQSPPAGTPPPENEVFGRGGGRRGVVVRGGARGVSVGQPVVGGRGAVEGEGGERLAGGAGGGPPSFAGPVEGVMGVRRGEPPAGGAVLLGGRR